MSSQNCSHKVARLSPYGATAPERVRVCIFLSQITLNVMTFQNIRASPNVVEYYSYSTRQMAYDYGMTDIVDLIDELNGMEWPWSHRSPRNVRLKKTVAEKQAERKDADIDAIDSVAGANMDHVVEVDDVIDIGHVVNTVERLENPISAPVPEKCVSFKLSDNLHAEKSVRSFTRYLRFESWLRGGIELGG